VALVRLGLYYISEKTFGLGLRPDPPLFQFDPTRTNNAVIDEIL
jgi:hypothetical protein